MKITEAVNQVRTACGESQQAFSNRLGVALNTISRYETGESRPAPAMLRKLMLMADQMGATEAAAAFRKDLAERLSAIAAEELPGMRVYLSDALSSVGLATSPGVTEQMREHYLKHAMTRLQDGLDNLVALQKFMGQ